MAKSNEDPRQPLAYFVPGELVLLVDHPDGQEFTVEELVTEAANPGLTLQGAGDAFEPIRRLYGERKVDWSRS